MPNCTTRSGPGYTPARLALCTPSRPKLDKFLVFAVLDFHRHGVADAAVLRRIAATASHRHDRYRGSTGNGAAKQRFA